MENRILLIAIVVIILVGGTVCISATGSEASGVYNSNMQGFAPGMHTWQQGNTSGFGDPLTTEVSALEAFNGYLYAGIHNDTHDALIYRSSDGATWTPVIETGFGISHDIAPRAILDFIVFDNKLYTSTGRGGDPAQIYRTLDGLVWAPMVIHGFSDDDNKEITALAEYNGMIYAGITNVVNGAQIWRSYTGDNNSWTKVAPVEPGTDVSSITGFAVFDGDLYAAIQSEAPAQIWRSYGGNINTWMTIMGDGFGDSLTTSVGGMAEFGGFLYVGAGNENDGALLYRTDDGDIWTLVNLPAFDDPNNLKVEMVYVFQNQLYVSLKNITTGMELWNSPDGTSWEQVNQDGFGDSNNIGTNWDNAIAEFHCQLYLGTLNTVDGGEIWRAGQQPCRHAYLPLILR